MKIRRVLLMTFAVFSGASFFSAVPAVAQQSVLAEAMLEEIVVTARRREESLQNLPLSIAAITAEGMRAQGIYNVEDVSEFIPNLTLTNSDSANNTRVFIRGVGGGFPDPVPVFGTGMYIDGHYIPYSVGGYMSTLDIERIEVLRGPQGTLFGKNATGGAVNIITAKPGPEFESSLTARAGKFGQQDIRGMINFPISDNVFARISAASEKSDGYYFNRNLNIDTAGKDLTALTAALRFTPGDHWTIDSTVSLAENRDDELGGQCAPDTPWVHAWRYGDGIENDPSTWSQGTYASCNASIAAGPFVNASDKRTFSHVDQEGVFVVAEWDSGGEVWGLENASVKTTASYRHVDYQFLQERDFTPFLIASLGTSGVGQPSTTRNFEVLFEGVVNERLDFVAGFNSFDEESYIGNTDCYNAFASEYDPVLDNDVSCAPFDGLIFENMPLKEQLTGSILGGPRNGFNTIAVWNESKGLFGHLRYSISDLWDLEFGIRYTEDDRTFQNIEFQASNWRPGPDPTALGIVDPIMNATTVLNGGFLNRLSDTFSDTTPMVSLTRALEGGDTLDSGIVYFLIAEGFLTGGFNAEINTTSQPALAPLASYGPEHVTNYEVGFKGTLLDGRVRLNSAVFFMDYTDKQDQIRIDNSSGQFGSQANIGVVQNASEVEIYGLELELRAQPWDGGFVTFDLGYLINEYSSYNSLNADDLSQVIDLSNAEISDLSPEWTFNASIEHLFTLTSGATLTPQLGVYYQSEYEYQGGLDRDSPPSFCHQESYAKWRARVTYEPADSNWEASLYGYNINDELIYERCGGGRRGIFTYRYERPETWGIEFSARWGNN